MTPPLISKIKLKYGTDLLPYQTCEKNYKYSYSRFICKIPAAFTVYKCLHILILFYRRNPVCLHKYAGAVDGAW